MKARKKDSNDEWKDVAYVQLRDSYCCLTPADRLEFQHDNLSTELKTYNQVDEEKHWQDVRERAAIAALQGIINSDTFRQAKIESAIDLGELPHRAIAESAIIFADALVEQLRRE